MSITKTALIMGLVVFIAALTYHGLQPVAVTPPILNPNGTPTPHPTVSVTPVPAQIITRTVVPTTTHTTVIPPLDIRALYALRDWTPPASGGSYPSPPPTPVPTPYCASGVWYSDYGTMKCL